MSVQIQCKSRLNLNHLAECLLLEFLLEIKLWSIKRSNCHEVSYNV